jgi:cardiolipin synthase (CMP-forming)
MRQLPNLLTAARLLAAPYIFYLLATDAYRAALAWFAIAGLTDVLDGFLARKFRAGSRFGALLDPVADKVMLDGAFLILGLKSIAPLWLTILVLGRDLMILGFAGVAIARGIRRDFPPSVWGKASTAGQIAYVLFAVGSEAGLVPHAVAITLGWIAAGLTTLSGIDYFIKVSRRV